MPRNHLYLGARLAHRAPHDVTFTHGVASGDPGPDRLVIWTRVALDGARTRQVRWVVARDPALRRPVAQGDVQALADTDGCVRVDVCGLPARSTLYYRFSVDGQVSRLGRTRTLAPHGLAPVRLAVCRDARHDAGFFHAYAQAQKHDDEAPLDAVLHLGDGPGDDTGDDALHAQRAWLARTRSDPDLQALLARLPWIGLAADAAPDSAALQAWHEWTPMRLGDPARPERLRREFAFGTVLRLVLDDAQPLAPGAAVLARHGTLWVLQARSDGTLRVLAADGRPVLPLRVPAVSGEPPGFLLLSFSADDLQASLQLGEGVREPEHRAVAGPSWCLPRQGAVLRPGDPRGSRGH